MEMVAGVFDVENKLAFCSCLLLYAQSANEKQIFCREERTPFSHTGVTQTVGYQGSGVTVWLQLPPWHHSLSEPESQPSSDAVGGHEEHSVLRQTSQNCEDA